MKSLWSGFEYKPHQTVGIKWMMSREKDGGGLLCDEMGLGKTIQMLGLIKSTGLRNSLLFAPLPVVEQWRDQGARSGINCFVFEKDKWSTRSNILLSRPNLYIINYESAVRKPEILSQMKWDRLICDEAHRLCSKGAAWNAAKRLEAKRVWLLTATPIVNSMSDIKALFELLGKEYDEGLVKEHILCRTMSEMRAKIPDLPSPPIEKTHHLDFETEEEAEFYRGIQGLIVKRWRSMAADGDVSAVEKFRLIMRLRQISLHPQVYIDSRKKLVGPQLYKRDDWIDPSTKFNYVHDLLDKEKHPRKWIVFCHFHKEMELLETSLRSNENIGDIWQYHGGVNRENRQTILEETQKPLGNKHEILLIQLQSGGVGLNLQHFSRIIFSGPWWTSALMEQAIGRAVRIGQKEQVIVHHMILKEEEGLNIDKAMREKAVFKGKLCRAVLNEANHTTH